MGGAVIKITWDVKYKELCSWITSVCPAFLTWNIAYMMHVRGRLCEYPATLKMLRPHLFRSSSSCNQNERDLRITVLFFFNDLKYFERFGGKLVVESFHASV